MVVVFVRFCFLVLVLLLLPSDSKTQRYFKPLIVFSLHFRRLFLPVSVGTTDKHIHMLSWKNFKLTFPVRIKAKMSLLSLFLLFYLSIYINVSFFYIFEIPTNYALIISFSEHYFWFMWGHMFAPYFSNDIENLRYNQLVIISFLFVLRVVSLSISSFIWIQVSRAYKYF